MGAAQTVSFFVQFASSVIIARFLSPHEMGIFAVGLATVGMLSMLQNFGLQPLIVREESLTGSTIATAFTINAFLSLIMSTLIVLSASLGGKFLRDEGVEKVLLILSLSPLFGIFSFLPGANLERDARFKETALISLGTSVFGATVSVGLVIMGFSYTSMAYANVASSGLLSVLFCLVGSSHVSYRIGLSDWRRVSNFGLHMFALSGITTFSQRSCELAIGRLSSLGDLGLYNRASGINNMVWGNIHYLISRVFLVDLAMLQRGGIALRDRYIQMVAAVTAVLWPAFIGLALVAYSFIDVVYGRSWEPAAVPLIFLAISSAIQVLNTGSWELCTVTNNVEVQTRVEAVRASISIPLFIAGCVISLDAAAFTRIVDASLAFALYRPHLSGMSNTGFHDLAPIYLRSAVMTAAAVTPVALVLIYAGKRPDSILLLGSAILVGIAFWALMLFALNNPLAGVVRSTLRGRFGAS